VRYYLDAAPVIYAVEEVPPYRTEPERNPEPLRRTDDTFAAPARGAYTALD